MAATQLLRPGHIIRARGESWIVHRLVAGPDGSVLDVRGRGPDNRGIHASFLLPFEPIERLPSSDAPRIVRPRTWQRAARSILAAATPSYDALRSPAHAALTVLPFQLEPALAVVRGLAARILIADDVGLGKTIQAGLIISELLERRPDSHILVVTPAGLRHQWQAELRDRFSLDATLLDSASISRYAAQWNGNPWSIPGVVLTSLDYVKRPEIVRAIEALVWDAAVFDEAHALAGRSDRATAAALLARRARTLVLLTATPHSGDDQAFTRLTSLGDVSNRFPLLVFRRTRLDAGMGTTRRTVSLRVRPTPHESEMHRVLMAYARLVWTHASTATSGARLAMGVLTRRACSSAWSLARSVETRLRLLGADGALHVLQLALPFNESSADDESPAAELSMPGLSDPDEERRWLEHVRHLAQQAQAHESKITAVRRLLRRTREPAIVFTEYRDTLHQLAHHLRDFAPVQLHGGMTAGGRQDVLTQFVGGEARLLLATDAASEGLNLHRRCRLVINLELPWTPVRLEQRIGRVERLGQTQRVHAVHLLAAGTCEEDSVAALLTRMRRVSGVLGSLRPSVCEDRIASVVIGHKPDNGRDEEPVSLPEGIIVANLRASATEEAVRLEEVRRLARDARAETSDARPCITVVRRRVRKPVNYWVYRLILEDPDLQPFWTTLVGLCEAGCVAKASRDAIRHHIESIQPVVEPALDSVTDRLLSSFLSAWQTSRSLAAERERAIADGVRQQRARLATSLLQRGLFDRRAERAAAAQNATLDEALGRCTSRLEELGRSGPAAIDRRLVLGLVAR
jgi:superfamily II DNA or RNA helicase